jgi:protein involved in polysaccharide export with SLBB domain
MGSEVTPMHTRFTWQHFSPALPLILLIGLTSHALARVANAVAQQPIGSALDRSPPAGVIRPGDLVRVKIWREPDLSGDIAVDEHGSAVFPRLGPMDVASLTADSLRSTLVHGYQAYLRNPSIEVTLLRRVNVLGAVAKPGLYTVDATTTVADVIALAGGVTGNGSEGNVQLLRNGERTRLRLSAQNRIGQTPARSGDQLYVPERSWVSRNPWLITAGVSAVASLVLAFTQ